MYGAAKNTRLAVSRNLESKRMEQVMARRMIFIVATDAACWVPVILLGILSLNGVSVPSQVCDRKKKKLRFIKKNGSSSSAKIIDKLR